MKQQPRAARRGQTRSHKELKEHKSSQHPQSPGSPERTWGGEGCPGGRCWQLRQGPSAFRPPSKSLCPLEVTSRCLTGLGRGLSLQGEGFASRHATTRKGRPINTTSLGQTEQVSRAKSRHQGSADTWVMHQDTAGHGASSATPSSRQPRCAPAWRRGCPQCCAGSWAALCGVTRHQSGASCPTGRTCPRPRPRCCLAHPRWLCVAHRQQRCHLPALPHTDQQTSSGPSGKGPRALHCLQSPLPEQQGHPQHIPRHNACL